MESETENQTHCFALHQIIADPRSDRTGRVRGDDDASGHTTSSQENVVRGGPEGQAQTPGQTTRSQEKATR